MCTTEIHESIKSGQPIKSLTVGNVTNFQISSKD